MAEFEHIISVSKQAPIPGCPTDRFGFYFGFYWWRTPKAVCFGGVFSH
jgi:hypothetical protein